MEKGRNNMNFGSLIRIQKKIADFIATSTITEKKILGLILLILMGSTSLIFYYVGIFTFTVIHVIICLIGYAISILTSYGLAFLVKWCNITIFQPRLNHALNLSVAAEDKEKEEKERTSFRKLIPTLPEKSLNKIRSAQNLGHFFSTKGELVSLQEYGIAGPSQQFGMRQDLETAFIHPILADDEFIRLVSTTINHKNKNTTIYM